MFGAVGAILAAIQQKKIVKSVQSGIAAADGNVTINAVDITKTMVLSASKGSAGYVAARGSISLSPSPTSFSTYGSGEGGGALSSANFPSYSGSISSGTTDLTVKVYSARLTNSTTIFCDGPVEWQVIEFA